MMWVALAVAVGVGAALWWWLARRNARSAASPLFSIVLLLRTPKPLNAEILAYHAGVVLGEPVRAGGDGDGPCVLGEAPHFVLMRGTDVFLIHSVPSPYSEGVPAGLRDLRLRKAYEDHTAWLSMDILRGENATAENWRIVGRMLARLVGRIVWRSATVWKAGLPSAGNRRRSSWPVTTRGRPYLGAQIMSRL